MLQVLNGYIMTNKNIAILGGTFNPVHIAHMEMIKYLTELSNIDEVWVLPSYNTPHKTIDTISSYNHRIEMLKLACNNINKVYISRFEEEYSKQNPNIKSYTYEILNEIKKIHNNYNIYFVVGFDSIRDISSWHRYIELIRDYEFYIFDRKDNEFKTIEQKKFYLDNLGKHKGINFKYKLLDCTITNISSSSIRTMLNKKDEYNNILKIFLDSKVLKYIEDNKLYGE